MRDVYTDGSCSGNPGPGGWAWIEYITVTGVRSNTRCVFFECGSSKQTTNNKMELTAVSKYLESVRSGELITIHSDSMYILRGLCENIPHTFKKGDSMVTGWLKNYVGATGKKGLKNSTEWKSILHQLERHSQSVITFCHVKAHSGVVENEKVDLLAKKACKKEIIRL